MGWSKCNMCETPKGLKNTKSCQVATILDRGIDALFPSKGEGVAACVLENLGPDLNNICAQVTGLGLIMSLQNGRLHWLHSCSQQIDNFRRYLLLSRNGCLPSQFS